MTRYYLIFLNSTQPANFVIFIFRKNRSGLRFQATFLTIRPGYIATCWCIPAWQV